MAGVECLPLKMKRKDIDRVNDDFFDFSLSSPARKIRRLDADLPPIMEEDEAEMAAVKPVVEELEPQPVNQERAIVLYNPLQAQQCSNGTIFVDTDFISGFKNQFLHPGYSTNARLAEDDYDQNHSSDICRAVVPWNPCHSPSAQFTECFQPPRKLEIIQLDEMGEDEMMGEANMEIEEEGLDPAQPQDQPQPQSQPQPLFHVFGVRSETEGLHQWQQQPHYMIPQLPQTNSTPISWFQ